MEVSPKKFADIINCNVESVYKDVQNGRLVRSVRRKGNRIFIDVVEGKKELLGQKPSANEAALLGVDEEGVLPFDDDFDMGAMEFGEQYAGQSLQRCQAVEKFYKAKLAEVQYRKARGDLVESYELERAYANEVASCRTKILAIPSRIMQRVPLDDDVIKLIESLIRESLEELGKAQEYDEEEELRALEEQEEPEEEGEAFED